MHAILIFFLKNTAANY